jgi:hypothetical protein
VEEITTYLLLNYQHLLSKEEDSAWWSLALTGHAIPGMLMPGSLESWPRMAAERRRHADEDPAIKKALGDGPDALFALITSRLLRDNATTIVLNRCPECQALCRTPRAKQCPNCQQRWD